jgi:predicted CoA-substrate-specific enzyme activase
MEKTMIRYGVDVGSTTAKIVTLTPKFSYNITESRNWKTLLEGIPPEHIASTGYFRHRIPHSTAITEITAAIYGVKHYFQNAEVIVDIGGQDTKIIDLQQNNFTLNDKCSAGTGAFLEFLAHYFGIGVSELATLHQKATKKVSINNTCSVFALSEMISYLIEGYRREDVIAGIHHAFAQRIAHMIPKTSNIVLIGGTAQNRGIITSLEEILKVKIHTPPNPQIINALGALKYAQEAKN